MKKKDLTGFSFNHLTAIKPLGLNANGKTVWLCKCDCGNETTATTDSITMKKKKSCGCRRYENMKGKHTTHGMTNSRLMSIWSNMKNRCYNLNCKQYKNYGGRGIKICDEWQEFINFAEWALENGYDENAPRGQCTIDRIDVNGDYCPKNCRWADYITQNNNMRSNKIIEYKGKKQTMAQWARELGIPYRTLKTRLRKHDVEYSFNYKRTRMFKTIKEYKQNYYKTKKEQEKKERIIEVGEEIADRKCCQCKYHCNYFCDYFNKKQHGHSLACEHFTELDTNFDANPCRE